MPRLLSVTLQLLFLAGMVACRDEAPLPQAPLVGGWHHTKTTAVSLSPAGQATVLREQLFDRNIHHLTVTASAWIYTDDSKSSSAYYTYALRGDTILTTPTNNPARTIRLLLVGAPAQTMRLRNLSPAPDGSFAEEYYER